MSYVNVGSFEQVFQKMADRAMSARKVAVPFHPPMSVWDKIRAALEPQWMTAAELAEKIGVQRSDVSSRLSDNAHKLRKRHRSGSVRKIEYRLK